MEHDLSKWKKKAEDTTDDEDDSFAIYNRANLRETTGGFNLRSADNNPKLATEILLADALGKDEDHSNPDFNTTKPIPLRKKTLRKNKQLC